MQRMLAHLAIAVCLGICNAEAQNFPTPEESEISTFGRLVQPGESFTGIETILLTTYVARYSLAGRVGDVERICSAIALGSSLEIAKKNARSCLARTAIMSGRFDEAEASVLASVADARRLSPGNERVLAASLRELSDLYRIRGFFTLSEKALGQAEMILEKQVIPALPIELQTKERRAIVSTEAEGRLKLMMEKLKRFQEELSRLVALDIAEKGQKELDRQEELATQMELLLPEMQRWTDKTYEVFGADNVDALYKLVLFDRWHVLRALGRDDEAFQVLDKYHEYNSKKGGDGVPPELALFGYEYLKREGRGEMADRYLVIAKWQGKRFIGYRSDAPDPLPNTFSDNPGAISLFGTPERSYSFASNIASLGRVYLEEGNLEEARRFLNAALPGTAFARGEDSEEYALLLYELSRVDRAEGRSTDCFQRLEHALSLIVQKQQEVALFPGGRTVALVGAQQLVALELIELLAANGSVTTTENRQRLLFKAFQSLRRSAAESAVSASSLRDAETDPDLRQMVEEYLGAGRRLLQLRTGYSYAVADRADSVAGAVWEEIQAQTSRLQVSRQRLENSSQIKVGSVLETSRPLTEVQRLLLPDEVLLQFAFGEERSYALATFRDAQSLILLPASRRELLQLTGAVKASLRPAENLTKVEPFPIEHAFRLYEKLLQPLEGQMRAVKRLLLVADGPLDGLSIGVLIMRRPAGKLEVSRYDELDWLFKHYEISYFPSASAFANLRARTKSSAQNALLGLGSPSGSVPPSPIRGSFVTSFIQQTPFLTLSPRVANGELERMRKIVQPLDSQVLIADKATKAGLHAVGPNRFKVLVFATHGYLASETRELGEPSLLLTADKSVPNSEYLTSSDVASLRLDANLVLLNACNTAGSDGLPGSEGLSGLASAFFFAGARALIVTLWPVEQSTATSVGVETIRLAVNYPGLGAGALLQRAMKLAVERGQGHFKHPLFWAPYVLVGDGNVAPIGGK